MEEEEIKNGSQGRTPAHGRMRMPFTEEVHTGNGGNLYRMEIYREFKPTMFMFLICSDQFSRSVMSNSL